jgi:hypothetical protein
VIVPLRLLRPMPPGATLCTNHTLPSGPAAMPTG